jgi:hypothetical protein
MLMTTWQSRVSATEAGLIYTSEPAFTAIYVLFLPAILGDFVKEPYANERFSISMAIGGSLILAANGLMQWKRTPKGSPPPVAGRAL